MITLPLRKDMRLDLAPYFMDIGELSGRPRWHAREFVVAERRSLCQLKDERRLVYLSC